MPTVTKRTAKAGKAVIPSPQKRKSGSTERGFFAVSLTGAALSLGIGLVVLTLAAAAAYSTADPDRLAFPLAAASLYTGALAGGIGASRIAKKAAYGPAAVSGALQSALMLVVSVFFREHYTYLLLPKLALHAGVFAAYMLGAFIGTPRKTPSAKARAAKRRRSA